MPSIILVCVIAFALALLLTMGIRLLAPSLGAVDIPNERSSHTTPTPRGGGASFVILTVAAAALLALKVPSYQFGMYAICSLAVAVVSYVDDLRTVPIAVRFGVQTAAAIAFVSAATPLASLRFVPEALLTAAVVFWIVSLTNIFNFIDGIDGIAASQAVITFSAMGIYSFLIEDSQLFILCFIAASATAGFLVLNWSPAKIFMGDVGSAFLGFTCASLSVIRGDLRITAVAAFAMWPFIFDATMTLFRRLTNRENILRAHRSHFYQRLTIAGYSHANVSSLYAAASVITSIAGILAASTGVPWLASIVVLFIPAVAIPGLVRRAEARSAADARRTS